MAEEKFDITEYVTVVETFRDEDVTVNWAAISKVDPYSPDMQRILDALEKRGVLSGEFRNNYGLLSRGIRPISDLNPFISGMKRLYFTKPEYAEKYRDIVLAGTRGPISLVQYLDVTEHKAETIPEPEIPLVDEIVCPPLDEVLPPIDEDEIGDDVILDLIEEDGPMED